MARPLRADRQGALAGRAPWAWPALVGVAAALLVQAVLASHLQVRVPRVLMISLLASLVGLVGAKHPSKYGRGHRSRSPAAHPAG